MAPLNASDEDIFRAHQEKTTIRLAENQSDLKEVDHRLEFQMYQVSKLDRKLRRLERREDKLQRKIDLQVLREKPVEKYEEKQSDLAMEVSEATNDLDRGEDESQALETQRRVMLRHRAALEVPLTFEAFFAAPIRRIPTEILYEIFTLLKPNDNQPIGTKSIHLVAQVCAEWRRVAVAHAALWTSFSCALFARDFEANLVETYLERSGAAPLFIQIYAGRRGRAPDRILAAISARSEQISTLRLTGEDWSTIQPSGFHGRLPQLEVLQLPSRCYSRFSNQFELAPRLNTLVMNDDSNHVRLPTTQIQSLHLLSHASPSALIRFSNIISLISSVSPHRTTVHGLTFHPTFHILLPYLVSWRIDFGDDDSFNYHDASDFFDAYTTPSLETLEIASLTLYEPTLDPFFQRSNCQLKSLVFTGCCITVVPDILAHTPGLESLTIQHPFGRKVDVDVDKLLEPLKICPDRPALLPGLRHLCIEGKFKFRIAILMDMLQSRSGTLCSARIALNGQMVEKADVQRLKALKESGMNVTLAADMTMAELMRRLTSGFTV